MTFLRRNGMLLAALIVMFAASLYAWPRVAEMLPVHWGFSGEPDRFGGRFEGLLLLPLVTLGVYALVTWLPRLDRKGARNSVVIGVVRSITVVGMTALHLGLVAGYLGWGIDIVRLASLVVGAILLATANVLPKAEPSAFVGVRVPWTLTSRKSWYASQRLGGWLLALTGLALLVVGFVSASPWALFGILAAMLVGLIGVIVYSYLVWRGDDERESAL
jgi:uncharacterized membrane protein